MRATTVSLVGMLPWAAECTGIGRARKPATGAAFVWIVITGQSRTPMMAVVGDPAKPSMSLRSA